jgi:hypothetical protein
MSVSKISAHSEYYSAVQKNADSIKKQAELVRENHDDRQTGP